MTTVNLLFHISKGHQLALNRVQLASDSRDALAYVARSHRNSGITAWIRPIPNLQPAQAGDISVCLRSRNHSMVAFVQPRPFYTTFHVAVLTPKEPMSIQEKLWWCLCIRANRFRFHFGRQANRTLGSLILPDTVPEWASTLAIPNHAGISTNIAVTTLNTTEWKSFRLSDLFSMHAGQHAVRRDLALGGIPLVTASNWHNRITAHIADGPDWNGGQITVANNGSVGAAFYQPRPFSASRDVTVLNPQTPISAAAALFICAIIRKESEMFSYARKWNVNRMRDAMVRLPAFDGTPGFQAMEALVRTLPLGWIVAEQPVLPSNIQRSPLT